MNYTLSRQNSLRTRSSSFREQYPNYQGPAYPQRSLTDDVTYHGLSKLLSEKLGVFLGRMDARLDSFMRRLEHEQRQMLSQESGMIRNKDGSGTDDAPETNASMANSQDSNGHGMTYPKRTGMDINGGTQNETVTANGLQMCAGISGDKTGRCKKMDYQTNGAAYPNGFQPQEFSASKYQEKYRQGQEVHLATMDNDIRRHEDRGAQYESDDDDDDGDDDRSGGHSSKGAANNKALLFEHNNNCNRYENDQQSYSDKNNPLSTRTLNSCSQGEHGYAKTYMKDSLLSSKASNSNYYTIEFSPHWYEQLRGRVIKPIFEIPGYCQASYPLAFIPEDVKHTQLFGFDARQRANHLYNTCAYLGRSVNELQHCISRLAQGTRHFSSTGVKEIVNTLSDIHLALRGVYELDALQYDLLRAKKGVGGLVSEEVLEMALNSQVSFSSVGKQALYRQRQQTVMKMMMMMENGSCSSSAGIVQENNLKNNDDSNVNDFEKSSVGIRFETGSDIRCEGRDVKTKAENGDEDGS